MNKLLFASLLVLTISTVYATVKTEDEKQALFLEALTKLVHANIGQIAISEKAKQGLLNLLDTAVAQKKNFKQLVADAEPFISSLTAEERKAIDDFAEKNIPKLTEQIKQEEEAIGSR